MDNDEIKKLEEWVTKHAVTSDGLNGPLKVEPLEDFDPDSVDAVVCGYAEPGAYRIPGAIDVECDDCKAMVILSPMSPVKPPKLCFKCALAREHGEQSINE